MSSTISWLAVTSAKAKAFSFLCEKKRKHANVLLESPFFSQLVPELCTKFVL